MYDVYEGQVGMHRVKPVYTPKEKGESRLESHHDKYGENECIMRDERTALCSWALPQDGEWLGRHSPGDGCRTPQSEGHVVGTLAGRRLLQT